MKQVGTHSFTLFKQEDQHRVGKRGERWRRAYNSAVVMLAWVAPIRYGDGDRSFWFLREVVARGSFAFLGLAAGVEVEVEVDATGREGGGGGAMLLPGDWTRGKKGMTRGARKSDFWRARQEVWKGTRAIVFFVNKV